MADLVYMVPALGVRVTHPVGSPKAMRVIPATGEWIRVTDYWQRREADGSILRAAPPAEPTAKPAAPAAKGKA